MLRPSPLAPEVYYRSEIFDTEMARLTASAWQLGAISDELQETDAYVRISVFGHDVVLQNLEGTIVGFHNHCHRHRGVRFKDAEIGVSSLACVRGTSESPCRGHLDRIRVEVRGRFVFCALTDSASPLDEYLGAHGPIFDAISANANRLLRRESMPLAANWKLMVDVSLDDYHVAAVHPTTFGAAAPMELPQYVYRQDGPHSSFFKRRDAHWSFDDYWTNVLRGELDLMGYKIFQTFPASYIFTDAQMSVCSITQPLGSEHSRVVSYLFDWKKSPLADDAAIDGAWTYVQTFLAEDRRVCEALQLGMHQMKSPAMLGALEERIGWFHEAYLRFLSAS